MLSWVQARLRVAMQGRYESGLAAAVNWTAAAEHMCADVSLSPHQRNSSEHNAHH